MGHRVIKGQVYTRLDQLLCMILAPSTGLSSLNLKVNLGMVQSEEPILRGYQYLHEIWTDPFADR